MTETMTLPVRGRRAGVLLGLLLVLALLLAGCGGEPTVAPTEPPKPTEISAALSTPTEEPTQAPTPTEEPTEPPTPTEEPTELPPTATPTEEPTPEPVDDTACINCHTDEETLKEVAEEPEETEALSEGEG
jgi:outer membrane biosynthesis protein TonB